MKKTFALGVLSAIVFTPIFLLSINLESSSLKNNDVVASDVIEFNASPLRGITDVEFIESERNINFLTEFRKNEIGNIRWRTHFSVTHPNGYKDTKYAYSEDLVEDYWSGPFSNINESGIYQLEVKGLYEDDDDVRIFYDSLEYPIEISLLPPVQPLPPDPPVQPLPPDSPVKPLPPAQPVQPLPPDNEDSPGYPVQPLPPDVNKNRKSPKAYFENLIVNSDESFITFDVELKDKYNVIKSDVAKINLVNENQEAVQSTLIYEGENKGVFFNDVAPGKYKLEVWVYAKFPGYPEALFLVNELENIVIEEKQELFPSIEVTGLYPTSESVEFYVYANNLDSDEILYSIYETLDGPNGIWNTVGISNNSQNYIDHSTYGEALKPNTDYTIHIKDSLIDSEENVMFSFKTNELSISSPVINGSYYSNLTENSVDLHYRIKYAKNLESINLVVRDFNGNFIFSNNLDVSQVLDDEWFSFNVELPNPDTEYRLDLEINSNNDQVVNTTYLKSKEKKEFAVPSIGMISTYDTENKVVNYQLFGSDSDSRISSINIYLFDYYKIYDASGLISPLLNISIDSQDLLNNFSSSVFVDDTKYEDYFLILDVKYVDENNELKILDTFIDSSELTLNYKVDIFSPSNIPSEKKEALKEIDNSSIFIALFSTMGTIFLIMLAWFFLKDRKKISQ